MPRIVAATLLILSTVTLTACGAAPKPFKPDPADEPQQLVVSGLEHGIQVDLVDGAPPLLAESISAAVADQLASFGIPASLPPFDSSRFILNGRAQVGPDANVIPFVTIRWQLTDIGGEVVSDITHPIDASAFDWEYGSPRMIADIAQLAAQQAADALSDSGVAVAQGSGPALGIFIEPVSGAPGDGDAVLYDAIGRALDVAGVRVTRDRGLARYLLEGVVGLGLPENNRQFVRITWVLRQPDGKEIGKATQENFVPEGVFDEGWRRLGNFIAVAAVDGIQDVVDRWENGTSELAVVTNVLELPDDFETAELPLPAINPSDEEFLGALSERILPPGVRTPPTPVDGARRAAGETAVETLPSETGETRVSSEDDRPPPGLPIDGASFLVAGVEGAPGNGNRLLRAALKQSLRARDLTITDDPRQANYVIKGRVDMSPPKEGLQLVHVSWFVEEKDGNEVGRARQENRVPEGSLDGNWGRTAVNVAAGAVPGIQRILGERVRAFSSMRNRERPGAAETSANATGNAVGEGATGPVRVLAPDSDASPPPVR